MQFSYIIEVEDHVRATSIHSLHLDISGLQGVCVCVHVGRGKREKGGGTDQEWLSIRMPSGNSREEK